MATAKFVNNGESMPCVSNYISIHCYTAKCIRLSNTSLQMCDHPKCPVDVFNREFLINFME